MSQFNHMAPISWKSECTEIPFSTVKYSTQQIKASGNISVTSASLWSIFCDSGEKWKYVCLHQLSAIGHNVWLRSLHHCEANRWWGPFFSITVISTSWHGWHADPGTLIPHPWGARQYGATWWPPVSHGSHTSHIPNNHHHRLLFSHTSITVAEWVRGVPTATCYLSSLCCCCCYMSFMQHFHWSKKNVLSWEKKTNLNLFCC